MIAKIVTNNSRLSINIDGKNYDALSFKSFRPTEKNITDFHEAGVRLFCILTSGMPSSLGVPYSLYGESWIGEYKYDFSVIDRQVELFVKNAPESYFSLMIQLDTRPWWLEQNPGYPNSFYKLSQLAADQRWRDAASAYLKAVITYVENKYGELFFGYYMLCGTTTEWFSDRDYEEEYPYKTEAYQRWLGESNAKIPPKEQRELAADRVFLHGDKERELIKYRRFHSELIADTLLYFAGEAQTVIKHNKLLGVYFGYVLELHAPRLWNAGSLDYEKVFLSDDINIICTPSSYRRRAVDDTSGVMLTSDTLFKRNKLYYLEFDHITHLAPQFIEGVPIPGQKDKFLCEKDTIDVMHRDFLLAVSKGMSLWWFDMFEGWFYSEGMMSEIKKMIEISKGLNDVNHGNISEIAFVVDPESLYYINKNNKLTDNIFNAQLFGLNTMGAPYDILSACDLNEATLKQYKMIIFANLYKVDGQRADIINSLRSNGRMLVWVFAPGAAGILTQPEEAVSEITGIKVRRSSEPENVIVCWDGSEYGFQSGEYDIAFDVVDTDIKVLGRFGASHAPALAYKRFEHYISAYSSLGCLSGAALRELAQIAGVHVYSAEDNAIYVRDGLIGLYHRSGSDALITIKKDGCYKDLFTDNTYTSQSGVLTVPYNNAKAKLLVEVRK